MKPTVPGPTRSAGEQIVWRALSARHQATALARRPVAVGFADPWPRVLAGDVPNLASLGDGIAGHDIEPGLNKQQPYVV